MVAKKTKAQNPVMPTATNPVMTPATDTKDMLSEGALDKVTGGVSDIEIIKYVDAPSHKLLVL
jgi:hypothetical protein